MPPVGRIGLRHVDGDGRGERNHRNLTVPPHDARLVRCGAAPLDDCKA